MNLELYKEKKRELKLTFDDLANLSKVPRRTIVSIFSGNTPFPRIDTVEAIEKALGINQAPDIGVFPIGNARIPLVGQVVAGIPVETSEYLESYITVDYPHPEEYFALRVNGDSMIGIGIKPNDVLVVKKQNYADNGDIVVASINGESTVKRYRVVDEHIFLMPENPKYMPIAVKDNLFIFGKVVEIRSKI